MQSQPKILHYANIEDEATDNAYEVFRFYKVDGAAGTAHIPRQSAFDPKEVLKELRRRNANLPSDEKAASRLISEAIKSEPRRAQLHCEATGWREGFDAFVTPSRVIDTRQRERILLPPMRLSKEQRRRQGSAGSLDRWRAVPEICGYSDLGMLLLSASFAASILAIASRGSFGLNVYARSKTGKSAMLVAGSSVSGSGEESELPSWNDTVLALGEKARHHKDILFPINETGSLRRSEAFESIRQAIYALTEGRERDRHSASGYAISDSSALTRTIFVSSTERSMEAYAGSANQSRDEGELARCLDVAATRAGRATVMDRFPDHLDPHQSEEWARRQLARLRDLCRDNHGLAVEPFVRHLMKDIPRVRREIGEDVEWFAHRYRPRQLSGAAAHAFDNVAMIFAGGSIAIDADLLPYDKEELAAAIWRCTRDSIPTSNPQRDPLTRAERDLRVGMRKARVYHSAQDGRFDSERFEGFVTKRQGRTTYVVRTKDFRAWFDDGDPLALGRALAWLQQRGCLRARRARATAAHRPADWASRTVIWPDRRAVRSVEFFDPFQG